MRYILGHVKRRDISLCSIFLEHVKRRDRVNGRLHVKSYFSAGLEVKLSFQSKKKKG